MLKVHGQQELKKKKECIWHCEYSPMGCKCMSALFKKK